MTDPLITQAEAIIRAAVDDPTAPPAIVAWQAANAVVVAGWTPPPGGDVVEAIARSIESRCVCKDTPRHSHDCAMAMPDVAALIRSRREVDR